LTYRWDLGDGTISREPFVKHTFAAPGFHRVGLTVNNGVFSDLAWRDLYVVEDRAEIGTEGAAAQWSWIDPASEVKFRDDAEVYVSGKTAVAARVEPYSGGRLRLQYPASRDAALTLAEDSHIVFWLRALNENIPAWQETNPVLTVYETTNRFVRLTPKQDRLTHRANNEEREGWTYFRVPISGDEGWDREGALVKTGNWLTIGLDSWGADPFEIWIDGLAVTP
jgi:hypothetical protein